jgi:hypothetical protein
MHNRAPSHHTWTTQQFMRKKNRVLLIGFDEEIRQTSPLLGTDSSAAAKTPDGDEGMSSPDSDEVELADSR